jgi:hypothetical protein
MGRGDSDTVGRKPPTHSTPLLEGEIKREREHARGAEVALDAMRARMRGIQGYLAHKKPPPPRTLQ